MGNLKINGVVKPTRGLVQVRPDLGRRADMRLALVPVQGGENYLSGVELLTPSRQEGAKLSYDAAYGGRRGRSAAMIAEGHAGALLQRGWNRGCKDAGGAAGRKLAAIGRKYEPSRNAVRHGIGFRRLQPVRLWRRAEDHWQPEGGRVFLSLAGKG